MAEIRKHNPASGSIGDLVRAAVGGGPRPVEVGSQSVSGDPYEPADHPETAPMTKPRAYDLITTGVSWTPVPLSNLPTVPKHRPHDEDGEDED